MKDALEALIRLFYPARCQICALTLEVEASSLCLECSVKLEEKRFSFLDSLSGAQKDVFWDEAWSLFPYEPPVRELIKSAKFNSKPFVLKAFRPWLKDFFDVLCAESPYDLLVPVPQDRQAWCERLFNPAEKIADLLSNGKIPIASDVIGKKGRVPSQSSLGREERLANPWGAFKMLRPGKVLNRRILVVDDILTTGATGSEVCRLIRAAGASKVGLLTLAKTQVKTSVRNMKDF